MAFALVAAVAALVGALLARFGGARGAAWGFTVCAPLVCLCLAGGLGAPWAPAIDGTVTAHDPASRQSCFLVIEGPSGTWREYSTPAMCAQCPVGAAARKPAWSLALQCRGALVDTSCAQFVAYLIACVGAAAGFAAYGASRLRRESR
jgi:hypothetical protein